MSTDEVNTTFVQGNLTSRDLASRFEVSASTINRRLRRKYFHSLPEINGRKVVVMMDATYWGRHFGVVIFKDAISGIVLWYKFISRKETVANYKEGVDYLLSRGFSIVAVVCDGLRGLRNIFTDCKFQLCQFHQVMTIRTKLTLHPKLEASIELLELSRLLCHTDKESFVGAFGDWENRWHDFLAERSVDASGKTHYVHKRLRSAYLSLKRNMPWLWTWYDFPELEIPNTNNALESLNSDLKAKLNLHRGMTRERRKVFIQDFLKAYNPLKNK